MCYCATASVSSILDSIFAMPGYSCCISAEFAVGGSIVRSTIRPDVLKRYGSQKPVGGFDLPMTDLEELDGVETMDFDQHRALLQATGHHYWIGRVYRNYDRGLDLYVEFANDPMVYKYELLMPPYAQEAEDYANIPNYGGDGVYPAPSQWYLATGKAYIAQYTPEEWAAMGTTAEE